MTLPLKNEEKRLRSGLKLLRDFGRKGVRSSLPRLATLSILAAKVAAGDGSALLV
jgi:hypothetical protein